MACFTSKIQQFKLLSFYSAWHQNRKAVSWKKSLSSWFSAVQPFQVLEGMFAHTYASSRVKRKSFYRKSELQMFLFPAAILVHPNGTPTWRLHTKLYKGVWKVSANNSETVGHKDLRRGQIVHVLVFYNMSFSWLLPLDGFQFIFFVAWQWKRSIIAVYWNKNMLLLYNCKAQQRLKEISII